MTDIQALVLGIGRSAPGANWRLVTPLLGLPHDAGQAIKGLERLRAKEQLRAKDEQQP